MGDPSSLAPDRADIAVVVVHGIGDQLRGATLLQWAEPLTRRLDHLSRGRGLAGATTRYVTLLDDEPSQIWIDVELAAGTTRTIVFTEARWAHSFLTVAPSSFFRWSVRFAWRAGRRTAAQAVRALTSLFVLNPPVLAWSPTPPEDDAAEGADGKAPLSAAYVEATIEAQRPAALLVLRLVLAAVAIGVGLAGLAAGVLLAWVLPVAALVLLPALALAARVPVLSRWARPVTTAMVTSLGDAAVWTTAPLRAAAMRDVVRRHVVEARKVAPRVAVVAHSQGAAVSAAAVFERPDPTPVDLLVTVGGANTLLRQPAWALGGENDLAFVGTWAATSSTRWVNMVALLDPVPSGPVGSTPRAVRERWAEIVNAPDLLEAEITRRLAEVTGGGDGSAGGEPTIDPAQLDQVLADAYQALGTRPGPIGPEEHVVENRLSLISDHVTYTQNIVQVIDPIARLIAEPDDVEPLRASTGEDVGRHVSAVTALLLSRFACAALAVLATPAAVRVLDRLAWVDTALAGAASSEGSIKHLAAFILDRGLTAALLTTVVALALFALTYLVIRGAWLRYEEVIAWGRRRRTDALAAAIFYGAFGLVVASVLVLAAVHAGMGAGLREFASFDQILVMVLTGATLLVPQFRSRFLVVPPRTVTASP
jgi:uncharacterized membrane protein YidH (DUF202 family)